MQAGVSRLKELLFDNEHEQLARLQTRVDEAEGQSREHLRALGVLGEQAEADAALKRDLGLRLDQLFDKVGDDDRLRISVTTIIDGALRDAEVQKHEKMSRAVAPLVVKTIKTELRNNRDEMVEALYPLTGRMVKSFVNSEIKKLKDQINQDLERRITSNPLMLLFKGHAAGRSAADIALADSRRLRVEELYLIRRGSGELAQRWPTLENGAGGLSNSDIHMSGVITAVNEFASHALKDDGNLRGFELDDCHIYLRASPAYLLAAKCRGVPPAGIEAKLDEEFVNVIERNRQILDSVDADTPPSLNPSLLNSRLLAPLAAALTASVNEFEAPGAAVERAGFNPLKILAWLVVVPVAAWLGWSSWTAYATRQVRTTAETVIASSTEMTGYPTTLDVSPRGEIVTLSGLAPSAAVKTTLEERLTRELGGSEVRSRLTVLPSVDPAPQIAAVRRDLSTLEQELSQRLVRRSVDRANQRLGEIGPDLMRLEQAVSDQAKRAQVRAAAVDLTQLAAALANPQLNLNDAVPAITAKLTAAADTLAALLQGSDAAAPAPRVPALPADLASAADNLAAAAERLAAVTLAVTQAAQIKPPPAMPPVPVPTPRDRLAAWMRDNAIFFGNGNEYRDAATANKLLDALAKLIIETKVFVRVVGFTDDSGSIQRNLPISQGRADKVAAALGERGVPPALLGAIGRANVGDLSTTSGAQSPNRRVEFALGFNGESGSTP